MYNNNNNNNKISEHPPPHSFPSTLLYGNKNNCLSSKEDKRPSDFA